MSIPVTDYTDNDRQVVGQILFERYGRLIPLQSADVELQLNPASEELTTCPALYWEDHGAHFVIVKTGESDFRCQFFYSDQEQFGTGRETYDVLGDCVMTVLQVQADHERSRKGVLTGMTAAEIPAAKPDDDEYLGPIVI